MEAKIINSEQLQSIKDKIKREEYEDLLILSDFDRTLTYGTKKGEKTPLFGEVLKKGDYLPEQFLEESQQLYDKRHSIDEDPEISQATKEKNQREWRTAHHKLLIKHGLSREHLKKVVQKAEAGFRKGVPEFLDFLRQKNIPLVVMSANGLGDAIPMFFEAKGKNYSNIHFVVNRFEWNENGKATGYQKPIILYLNKGEVLRQMPEIYHKVKSRKNVILLGDSIDDLKMAKGFDYDQLLTIGFLYYNIEQKRELLERNYDVVLKGDGDFSFICDRLFGIRE